MMQYIDYAKAMGANEEVARLVVTHLGKIMKNCLNCLNKWLDNIEHKLAELAERIL